MYCSKEFGGAMVGGLAVVLSRTDGIEVVVKTEICRVPRSSLEPGGSWRVTNQHLLRRDPFFFLDPPRASAQYLGTTSYRFAQRRPKTKLLQAKAQGGDEEGRMSLISGLPLPQPCRNVSMPWAPARRVLLVSNQGLTCCCCASSVFCDYCDVYLTHDSMSVRKAHNSGRNHLRNVVDYYQRTPSSPDTLEPQS